MIDPTSADAYYADWNGRTVTRDVAPPVPEVTVLTPVTLTEEERDGIIRAVFAPDASCAHNVAPLMAAVERIVTARLLEQATR